MSNIIQVARDRDEIIADLDYDCPRCGERLYSTFDKLYAATFGKCVDDTDNDTELMENGEIIFQII